MSNQQQIPAQFSSLGNMGNVVSVHPAKVSVTANTFVSGVFILSSGIALLIALAIGWDRWGRAPFPEILSAILPWIIVSAVSFGISALLVWRMMSHRKIAAVIFTNGFAYSDRKGVQVWRWEQVEEITANVVRHYALGLLTGTSQTYTLRKSNGERLVLSESLQDIESLYHHLENSTLKRRYQHLAESYNHGNTVTFGPVHIGKQIGIQIGTKSYPWEEIGEVVIDKGVLSIKKKDGGWHNKANTSAGEIPNLHILLSIINQIVGLKAGE
jgi:hypothetical protein